MGTPCAIPSPDADMGLAEHSPAPMLAMDRRGNVMWFNAAAEHLCGPRSEAGFLSFGDILTNESWSRARTLIGSQTPHECIRFEVDVETSGGHQVRYQIDSKLVQDGSSGFILCVGRALGARPPWQADAASEAGNDA